MSRDRSFNRYMRFLAKKRRRSLKELIDFESPKDSMIYKFKRRKEELQGT